MQTDVTAVIPRTPGEDVTPPRSGRDTARWIILIVLALGWIAGVVWRMWLGSPIGSPIAHADEDSYVNVARALTGGPNGYSSETALFRRVGYPMFISPAFWPGLEFADSYRLVHVLNAIANAATLPLTYLLARRMFKMPQWPAMAAAFVAATLGATVFWSLVGMTDSVMTPLLLGWLLAIHWWLAEPGRKLAALTTGAMLGLLYIVHIRGTILVVVFVGFLALMLIRRRSGLLNVALSIVPLAGFIVLNQLVIMFLGTKIVLLKNIVGGQTVDALADADRLQVLFAAVGTNIWYMLVASLGLAGIAWWVTGKELFRPTRDVAYRWTALLTLASTIAVVLGASVILAGLSSDNADALYSRYVQMFVPFYVLFGFAVLLDSKLRTVLSSTAFALLILVAGGGMIAYRLHYVAERGHHLNYGAFGGPDLMTMTLGWHEFRPIVATVVGAVGLLLIVAFTRVRRLAVPVIVAFVLLNVGILAVMRQNIMVPFGALNTPEIRLPDLGVTPKDKIAVTWGQNNQMHYSLYHETTWMQLKNTDVPPPGYNVMIARWRPGTDKDWDGTKYGFHRVGGSPKQQWAVWRKD